MVWSGRSQHSHNRPAEGLRYRHGPPDFDRTFDTLDKWNIYKSQSTSSCFILFHPLSMWSCCPVTFCTEMNRTSEETRSKDIGLPRLLSTGRTHVVAPRVVANPKALLLSPRQISRRLPFLLFQFVSPSAHQLLFFSIVYAGVPKVALLDF